MPANGLSLLREVLPGLSRLAALGNAGNPTTAPEMLELQTAARTLGLQIVISEIRRAEDIAPAIEAFKDRADALYIQSDPVCAENLVRIDPGAESSNVTRQ